jgi:hypothetical protein
MVYENSPLVLDHIVFYGRRCYIFFTQELEFLEECEDDIKRTQLHHVPVHKQVVEFWKF